MKETAVVKEKAVQGLRLILLVEANERDVELCTTGFGEAKLANYVVRVRDSDEALDFLYRRGSFEGRGPRNPAVVFLGLNPPHIEAAKVLGQLKSDTRLKRVPVVILASSRSVADIASCYGLGASAYVVKPHDSDQFVGVMKQLGIFWAVLNEPPPSSDDKEK